MGQGREEILTRVCVMSLRQERQGLIGPRWELLREGRVRWETLSTPVSGTKSRGARGYWDLKAEGLPSCLPTFSS